MLLKIKNQGYAFRYTITEDIALSLCCDIIIPEPHASEPHRP